jgi:WD40 repeat protein
MKKQTVFMTVAFLALLSACNNPIIVPANVAVTLPPNQDFILMATVPPTPSATPGPELLAPTVSPVPISTTTGQPDQPTQTPTLTFTPTRTPRPTRSLPYPVAIGTPLIDMGIQTIDINNVTQLSTVFSVVTTSPRHFVMSADGQKLFLSTSSGMFLFNRQGEVLARWPNIFTAAISCESCISTNHDGSRIAVITRNAGNWEAQVYDVQGSQATQILALPVEPGYKGLRNEASIAISPDNSFLAYQAGSSPLRVIDLQSKLQVLNYERPIDGINFTADGAKFVVHAGLEMLFYQVSDWKSLANLLLPREDVPYAFSPDGSRLAIALPTILQIYSVENVKLTKEINVPPGNASTREWQLAFKDNTTLSGYAVRWDSARTTATIESGQWDLQSGKALSFDTSTGTSPDALAALWGSPLSLPAPESDLEIGPFAYNAFRFVSDGLLLINSPHSACWVKLFTGENTCFQDPDHILFASDANIYKEVRENADTNLLEFRGGKLTIQTGPYRIAAINRSGEWALVDNGTGVDLYTKGKKLPQESVNGQLQGFSENGNRIVFTTLENANSFNITVVDKATGNALYQKKDNFLYKPVIMTVDGTIYYIQNELGHNQTVFNVIDPKTLQVSEITRLSLPAEPQAMTLSSTGLFAVGLKDGSVSIITRDGSQNASFQAASSPIGGISFSPDGRFLAVESDEGVRVFAIVPGQ